MAQMRKPQNNLHCPPTGTGSLHQSTCYIKGRLSKPPGGLTSPSIHETNKYYIRYDLGLPQLHKILWSCKPQESEI